MPAEKPNTDYRHWPIDPEERKILARDLMGARIIAQLDGSVVSAHHLLFKNHRLKLPSLEKQEVYEWIDGLDDKEKQILLNLIADQLDLAFYGLMCDFDGVGGNLMHNGFAESMKLGINIVKRTVDGHIQDEKIEESFDVKDSRQFFYQYWHEWKERFSVVGDLIHAVSKPSATEL